LAKDMTAILAERNCASVVQKKAVQVGFTAVG
jgi:hypothetical protein